VVYWKGSCPLLVGGLLLLKEVLLLQRQEEGSQKEGVPMSLNRDLNRNLNRARGTLWCVPKGVQPTAAWDAEREERGMGACSTADNNSFCREEFLGAAKEAKGVWGKNRGLRSCAI